MVHCWGCGSVTESSMSGSASAITVGTDHALAIVTPEPGALGLAVATASLAALVASDRRRR